MHTPGPWTITKPYKHDRDTWIQVVFADNSGTVLKRAAEAIGINEKQCQANARLVARAPELLEFVVDIATMFKWHEGTMEYLVEAAQELVRKAKGE